MIRAVTGQRGSHACLRGYGSTAGTVSGPHCVCPSWGFDVGEFGIHIVGGNADIESAMPSDAAVEAMCFPD
ncbi:hypothetical protein KRMM14A1259_46150 [Krasilnikovia sp. MM14-A1259]